MMASGLNPRPAPGTTLIELTIVLLILGVLADLGLRGWSASLERHQSKRVARDLLATISLARTSSVMQKQWVTICPSMNGTACSREWGRGVLVFLDADRDARLDPEDRTIHHFRPIPAGSRLSWRSFRNKPYIQITQTGRTNHQNGSFIYCPANGDPRNARVVIISKLGRVRLGPDLNRDGISETASGKPVSC